MHALNESFVRWFPIGWFPAGLFAIDWSEASFWVRLGVDSAAKATVLLVLAWLTTALWRNSSAALRHRVWCLTFAGLVILPGLSAALPAWRLPILPPPVNAPVVEAAPERPLVESPTASVPDELAADTRRLDQPWPPVAERGPRHAESAVIAPPVAQASAENTLASPAPPAQRRLNLPAVWLLGLAFALSPLAVGLARNALVRWRARRVSDAGWADLLDELRRRLTLRRRVLLLETESAVMPMTWGLVRPVVLLPRQAREWAERLRRFVLLHELAHVKRGDVAFQVLARVACALYWFHPLTWLALRRLRVERELACDDCVLAAGERPSDYAAELLRVAHDYRPAPLAAAVAMAQRGSLEHRIRALLDRARSHLPVSARMARVLLVLAAAIVTTIAAIRPGPRAADDEHTAVSDVAASDKKESSITDGADQHRVHGRVVDENGQPIAGARVCVVRTDTEMSTWVPSGRLLADARTDAAGEFIFEHFNDPPRFATRERFVYPTALRVLAFADGRALDWVVIEPGDDRELVLRLLPDRVPIEGQVVDLEGRPLPGVRVSVNELTAADGDVGRWAEAARRNPAALREEWALMRPKPGEERPTVSRFPGRENLQLGLPELLPTSVTDATGRFRLKGLGADRLARLELSGPAIATAWVHAVTRAMPSVPYPVHDPRFRAGTCFGARFVTTAEPDQPIQGTVTDADTGAPLVGAEVRLEGYAGSLLLVEGFLAAITDERGHYVLRGIPKPNDPEHGARLRIVPAVGQPYFRTEVTVAKTEGLGPVTADARLKRAKLLRGHVRDSATGRPIRGLVSYWPFLTNQAAEEYENFEVGSYHSGDGDAYAVDDDGAYEISALPGRGVVTFIALDDGYYPRADGAAEIDGLIRADDSPLGVYHLIAADVMTALREVVVPADAPEAKCDIEVRSLPVTKVRLVDEAGQPVTDVLARGLTPPRPLGLVVNEWPSRPLSGDVAEVVGLGDDRTLLFLHRGRKLAAALRIVDGNLPEQIVLRPCASIAGRLVDASGKPLPDALLTAHVATGLRGGGRADMPHQLNARLSEEKPGQFRFDFVPPGVEYVIEAKLPSMKSPLRKTTATIEPGETLDLGDLVLPPDGAASDDRPGAGNADAPLGYGATTFESTSLREVTAADDGATKNAAASEGDKGPAAEETPAAEPAAIVLRGQVLGPKGEPVAGAGLYWRDVKSPRPQTAGDIRFVKRAATDQAGRFELSIAPGDLPPAPFDVMLVAHQPGFGLDWIKIAPADSKEITLRLVEDRPIHGRVIDTEGRPLVGVPVSVNDVMAPNSGKLDEFLAAWLRDWDRSWPKLDRKLYAPLDSIVGTVTDQQGRFELSGIGLERVATVEISPPGCASSEIKVVHRADFDAAKFNQAALDRSAPERRRPSMTPRLAGPEFEHIAEAEFVVRGTVFLEPNRTPLAGVEVVAGGGWAPAVSSLTDAAGRYALHGLPRGEVELVSFQPPVGSDLLSRMMSVTSMPGETAVDLNVELKRGIVVEGRVFDKVTSRGVKGGVRFVPLPGNAFVDQPGYDGYKHSRVSESTDAAGRFRVIVPPGAGVMIVQVYGSTRVGKQEIKPYRQANFTAAERERVAVMEDDEDRRFTAADQSLEFLSIENAVKVIDLPPDSDSFVCDLPVDPGKTAEVAIEDDQGRPLSNVSIAGITDGWPHVLKIAEPHTTIFALGADRPRRVCILHPARRLAASLTLTGDEAGPVTARLAPSAGIVGRALDASGAPIAGAAVQINYARRCASELDRFVGLEQPAFTTDDDGRFRVENVLPDERFALDFKQADHYFRANLTDDQRRLSAGQTLELGETRAKQIP